MLKNLTALVFEKLTLMLDEPSWLQQKRKIALQNFQNLGLPSRKSELWKYTNVAKLNELAKATDLAESNEYFVFTIKSELPAEAAIQDITQMNAGNWQDIQTDKERIFIELNTAMLNAGFELTIPKNSKLKLHIQYQQISDSWENIRTIINVEENAQLELTESYDYDCRINHVAIINMASNSRLKLQSDKLLGKTAALIHYSQINCAQNVSIEQGTINNNAALAHSILDVNFNGQHSEFSAASVNVVHDSCHISENIQVNHKLQNCKSHVVKRSIATDKASIATNAKAVVAKGADGSDIAQSLKNILLSDDAKIYSRPELEINTDDVIAAHGATTGELDELALTYLRSRGIPKQQAQIMLIESFLQDANIFKAEDFLARIEL
ncbi:hypothetical protein MNBD_GAMMA01-53 [hydrothermal vent metagenome]|uniref:Iron-sulfur cluster assembly protein SufD n=1 Tax=hydrothermal vent metagenome TaxID=652676 RepID=A0A3B0VKR2_9ZZZZ